MYYLKKIFISYFKIKNWNWKKQNITNIFFILFIIVWKKWKNKDFTEKKEFSLLFFLIFIFL